jgi:hypothetical protein
MNAADKVVAQHTQPPPRRAHQLRRSGSVWREPWERREARPNPTEPGKETLVTMLTRASTNAVAHRASSMRRMRRRAVNANRLYCATNGCTSFLVIDELGGVAHCEICGYSRRLN